MLANQPTGVDTYFIPTDAAAAKAAIIALVNSATLKIRMALSALQDADIIAAIDAKFVGGLTDIKIAIDWYTAHLQWEYQSIHVLRSIVGNANAAYTVDPTTNGPTDCNIATFDDLITVDGSAAWTANAWRNVNTVLILDDATLAAAHSAKIDTLIAWNLSHMPQTP